MTFVRHQQHPSRSAGTYQWAAYASALTRRSVFGWLVATVLMTAWIGSAAAQTGSAKDRIIVLHTRVGSLSPTPVDDVTSLVNEQFEAEGFAARPATIASLLGGRLPRPGILDPGLTAADIIHPVEIGYDEWTQGLFAEAEKKLSPALSRIYRNPALLVADTKNLDAIFKALVALALSQAKLGKATQSAETMLELIRMFGSRPLSRAEYGPPAEKLYRTISKQSVAAGRGQLFVTTSNDHAVVFVNGQIRGIGKAEVADLIPGWHHVFVQVPATFGRQYQVEIKANEATHLETVWDVDIALAVSDSWIGLVFATEAERNKEALFAGQLARRWGGPGVVVMSTTQIQGKPFLIGTLYGAGGAMFRSAATSLDGDRRALFHSLAKYLADGTERPGLKVLARDRNDMRPVTVLRESVRSTSWTPPLVAGLGALAFVAGGSVYVTSEADDFTQPTYDNKRSPAVQVMLGSSVVLGAGVYLWLRDARAASVLSSALVGAGTSAILSGGAMFLTDEDLHRQGFQRPTYRDTARLGVTVGAAGLAMTSVGLWLLRRESKARSPSSFASLRAPRHSGTADRWTVPAPIVSVGPSHAVLRWVGSF